MPAPTENDYNVFYSVKDKEKFEIIKYYLWTGKYSNMKEAGMHIFGDVEERSAGERVSAVTRCYGFGGQNCGVFRKWGIANSVNDNDIKAFVSRFRNGCRYDGNGTEMYQFLKKLIDNRAREENERRRRDQEAAEERRRIEIEERRRQQRIEAEERQRQETLRKQHEEQERIQREFQQQQINAKNKAEFLAKEAENIMLCTNNINEIKRGICKYQEALSIFWYEFDVVSLQNMKKNLVKSECYLSACERIALTEYGNCNYDEALKYCHFVCSDMGHTSWEQEKWAKFIRGIRNLQFHPEVTCLTIMSDIYLNMGSIGYFLQFAELGASIGGIRCMELLGDYYGKSSDINDILLSCYYYERMGNNVDTQTMEKRNRVLDIILEYRSKEVDSVLKEFRSEWMPEINEKGISWEKYSNLSEQLSSKLYRKPKNNSILLLLPNENGFQLEKMGYQAGIIDLADLWNVYKRQHSVAKKKGLIFKKVDYEYQGELMEGDFVDCCKYIWNKKYNQSIQNRDNMDLLVNAKKTEDVLTVQVQPEPNGNDECDDTLPELILNCDDTFEEAPSTIFMKNKYCLEKNKLFVWGNNGQTLNQLCIIDWLQEGKNDPAFIEVNENGIYIYQNLCEITLDGNSITYSGGLKAQRFDIDGAKGEFFEVDEPVTDVRMKGTVLIYSKLSRQKIETHEFN